MNTLIMVIFLVLSAFTLVAGIMVVTVKNIIHSALWLIASFFAVAAMYLLMEAEFIAIVQVLIYVGAISILILFAIMLTRHVTGEGIRQLYQRWWIALLVAAALFGLLIAPTVAGYGWNTVPPAAPDQVTTISSVGADRYGVYARIPAAVRDRLGAAAGGADRRDCDRLRGAQRAPQGADAGRRGGATPAVARRTAA